MAIFRRDGNGTDNNARRSEGAKSRWRLSLVAIAIMALSLSMLLIACGGDKEKEDEVYTIGVLSSFTGPCGPYGQPNANGAKLAAQEINAEGGLMGSIPIHIIEEDTESNPDVAIQKVRRLFDQQDADAVFGVECSFLRDAIMPDVEERNKLMLYAINYEGERYSDNAFFFGMVPAQEHHPALYDFLLERSSGNRWAMIGSDYIAFHMIDLYLREVSLPEKGIELVIDEFAPLEQTDFSSLISRIQKENPDHILNNMIGPACIAFQQQLANAGITPLRAGEEPGTPGRVTVSGHCFITLTADAIGEAAEGVYRSINWNETLDTPAARKFTADYKAAFPNDFMLYASWDGYVAIKALAAAAEKAGSVDIEDLKTAMVGVELDSPTGPIRIREDHHTDMPLHLMQVQNGEFVVVDSFGLIPVGYDQREPVYSSQFQK